MKASIKQDECIGCGVCANICPDGIVMEDNIAVIKNDEAECLKEAADSCPISIIKIL